MSRSTLCMFFWVKFSLVHNYVLELTLLNSIYRLLALATRFATKMIRKYGLLQNKENACIIQSFSRTRILSLPPVRPEKVQYDQENSRRLREMAHFLEIIRNLQHRLSTKFRRPGQGLVRGCMILLL